MLADLTVEEYPFHHGDTDARETKRGIFGLGDDFVGSLASESTLKNLGGNRDPSTTFGLRLTMLRMTCDQRSLRSADFGERTDGLFENAATVFIVLELVETGAGGGEKDDVSGLGGVGGALDGLF